MASSDPRPKSELVLTSAAPSVPESVFAEFSAIAKLCHACLEHVAKDAGLPSRLELVLADDFKAEVLKRMRGEPVASRWQPERPLGRVAAKNLAQDDLCEHVAIVFDAKDWVHGEAQDASRTLLQMSLMAHELAHPALERIRIASGVAKGVIYPSVTPGELARSLSRTLADEYFADRISDIIVSQVFSKGQGDAKQPAFVWDLRKAEYTGTIYGIFERAYTVLPGLVNSYRIRLLALGDMWAQVVSETEQMLTMFIHARGHADAAGNDPLLGAAGIKELPFVRLYLADTLPPFLEQFRDTPPLLAPNEWARREEKIVRGGETAIMEIWRRLGLTFEESHIRENFFIKVAAPALTL
jgi:hypothetical protein